MPVSRAPKRCGTRPNAVLSMVGGCCGERENDEEGGRSSFRMKAWAEIQLELEWARAQLVDLF